jgi:hypothetical protein
VFSEYPTQNKRAVIGNDRKLISKIHGLELYRAPNQDTLTQETIDNLKALGYIQ